MQLSAVFLSRFLSSMWKNSDFWVNPVSVTETFRETERKSVFFKKKIITAPDYYVDIYIYIYKYTLVKQAFYRQLG